MASVTLHAYEVTIKQKRNVDAEVLSDFNNGKDIINFLNTTLSNWSYEGDVPNVIEDSNLSKRLRINKNTLSIIGRKVSGQIEIGEYGYESQVVDGTGSQTKKIEKDESPMMPFFFVGFFPKDKAIGILVFQKFKNYGVYTIFEKSIKDAFKAENDGFIIEIQPLASKELVENFLNAGALRQISFKNTIRNQTIVAPSDREPSLNPDDYYTEYNIIAKKGKRLSLMGRIRAYLNGTDNLSDLIAINNYEFNEITATLKLENHARTIKLSSGLDNIGSFFDITSEVTINPITGLPEFDTVKRASEDVLNDISTIAGLLE